MKKLLLTVLLVGVGACAPSATTPPRETSPASTGIGASSPQGAVERFLASVRSQDLQAMSIVWGTEKGPARENMPREELEKREIILQCYLKHDSYKILNEGAAKDGRRIFEVELTNKSLTRTTTIHAVQGPRGRWYVEKTDIAALRDFCSDA
jgi:hypothetical protein